MPGDLPDPHPGRRLAVIGAGWAGLAAAVEACGRGDAVSLYEMATGPGGRARRVDSGNTDAALDNGQHILIGAYAETLALMRRVGADPDRLLLRRPLSMAYPDGDGLILPAGPAIPAFVRAVWGQQRWPWRDRMALLSAAIRWRLGGFTCPAGMTVAALTAGLPARLRQVVIDPLCVAALNTPADQACARVFLRVLRDALFAGPGASDLLLPRVRLSALLPDPALAWLRDAGADVWLGRRVQRLVREGVQWRVDAGTAGGRFDRVVLACTATEAARLVAEHRPDWAATAGALRYEPICSLTLDCPGTRLPAPMLALHADPDHQPAQFVFDQGQLDGPAGRLTLVISGAAPWVARGREATVDAALAQVRTQLGRQMAGPPRVVALLTDKRATFRCTPALARPPMRIADGLLAAGDHVEGPYPATLEGAVRSGLAAARAD